MYFRDADSIFLLETKELYRPDAPVVKLRCKCAAHFALIQITTLLPEGELEVKEITYSGAFIIRWKMGA